MRAFVRGYLATWRAVLNDRMAILLLIAAAVFYSFYYPMAYRHQVASRLPTVVVDLDRSPLSRALVRKLDGLREIELRGQLASLDEAKRWVQTRRVDGIALIEADFQRSILRGEPGRLTLFADGSRLGEANTVLQGLAAAIADFSMDAAVIQAQFAGAAARPPITLVQRPLYNTREGYASSVVAGVSYLIVHQLLVVGIGVLIGTWQETRGRLGLQPAALAGALAAFWSLGLLSLAYYSGFVVWFQDFPRPSRLLPQLLGGGIYIAAVVAFGAFLGSFFRVRERALQLIIVTSMPMYFLAGLSWPRSSMPAALADCADLLPSTSGIIAMIKLGPMGGSLAEASSELTRLGALALIYGALAFWRFRPGVSPERLDTARAG